MKLLTERMITTRVSRMSLVGVSTKQFPVSYGNYCWVYLNGTSHVRVLNMWEENIKEANRRFVLKGKMKAMVFDRFAIIVDERIPKEWRYDKLCYTGVGLPPIQVAREMYDILGDPTNEFERFVDPKSYYAKRGGVYHPSGSVSYDIK